MAIEKKPRVGLVLGAGGVLGGAWMAGALHALAERTRFYPRHADQILGTSAGSVLAVLGGAGVPPWLLIPESSGNVYHGMVNAEGKLEISPDLWTRIVRKRRMGLPRFAPGSISLTLAGLRQGRSTFLKTLSGLAPVGFMSTDPIKESVGWVAPGGGWVDHPGTWVVACDYQTGERVVFGRQGAPEAGVAAAVSASCAIPGFYCPERIGGRLYVDGGLHSMSNLDLMEGLGLDLVIVLSPHSTRARFRGWDPLNRFTDATRRVAARQVDGEIEKLQKEGTRVLLLEPGVEDLVAIGSNVMNERRRGMVMRTAMRTTRAWMKGRETETLLAMIEQPARPRPALSPLPAPRARRAVLRPSPSSSAIASL